MNSKFSCNAKTFQYTTTRRGVNALCPIMKDGKMVATLHDVADHICAKVEFINAEVRAEFLAEASILATPAVKAAGDNMIISEYARKMTMQAEEALCKI